MRENDKKRSVYKGVPVRKNPLYKAWAAIKRRCYNSKDGSWKNYGGRGIKMCGHWFYSYRAFEEDMLSIGWKPGLCIHRKANNRGYFPGNIGLLSRSGHSTHHIKEYLEQGEPIKER